MEKQRVANVAGMTEVANVANAGKVANTANVAGTPAFAEKPAYDGHPVQPVTLVLEGGGLRCQFTSGVLDFFMERGLVCEHIIGVSAGALSGMNYAAGLHGRTAFMNLKYCDDDRYFSMKSFRQTGNVCGREFIFHELMDNLLPFDKRWYTDSPMRLTAVSTNLITGEADYHHVRSFDADLDYLIASSSLPFLSQPVCVDGKILLDGGTVDSIPFEYALGLGSANKVVVVLTQDATYRKKPGKLLPITERKYRAYPYYVERLRQRWHEYNRTQRNVLRAHDEGRLFALLPDRPVTIKSLETDREKLLDLYAQGYEQAALHWDELRAFIG